MRTKIIMLSMMTMCLAACATISENAANVQVHSQMSSLLDKCQKVGPVVGVGSCAWSHESGSTEAKINIREKTVGKGDSVVILNEDHIGREARLQGIIFKCYDGNPK